MSKKSRNNKVIKLLRPVYCAKGVLLHELLKKNKFVMTKKSQPFTEKSFQTLPKRQTGGKFGNY